MTRSLIEYVVSDEYWNEIGDPRVEHLPLVGGAPIPIISIVALYLVSIKILHVLMKNRQPMQLRAFMLLYNAFLVAFNGILFLAGLFITDFGLQCWFCYPVMPDDFTFKSIAGIYIGYVYLLLKIADFGDTIIFCLRKKKHQITFLHCFHHSLLPLTVYLGLKLHPGGMSAFTPIINTLVHCVMHTYYLLSAVGPASAPYLWWKKYLTILQLTQFGLVFVHALHTFFVPNCTWPPMFAVLEATEALFFFLMFSNFYRKTYPKRD